MTTLAVLFAAFRAELRGQAPRLFDRALPDGVVRRAMRVPFLATLLVLVVWFLNERQAAVLRTVGATRVVLVEAEMGRRLAPEVLSPAASDLMEQAAAFRVIPWCAQGVVVGKTLADLDLPRRFEITVLGFWRANDLQAGPPCSARGPTTESKAATRSC